MIWLRAQNATFQLFSPNLSSEYCDYYLELAFARSFPHAYIYYNRLHGSLYFSTQNSRFLFF